MTDKKLTDEQIKEALNRCGQHNECCYCNSVEECGNKRILTKATLDLINRLEAENERLKEEIELLHSDYTYKFVKEKAKAEAYKECIAKVKKELSLCKKECRKFLDNDGAFAIDKARKKLDNLLKELVGE